MNAVLEQLSATLEQRKKEKPDKSYVASLYEKGTDEILKKIGEESAEVIIAGKNGNKSKLVHEIADLWFHSLVMLAYEDLGPDDVLKELEKRFGKSGLVEKAERTTK